MVQMTINFDDKKVNKTTFYKNKKLYDIYDIDTMEKRVVLNILLDIMMKMILLDPYVSNFHK